MTTPPKPDDYVSTWIICDGACEPTNPGGTMAAGYVIMYDGRMVRLGGKICPGDVRTNNVAELKAVGVALEQCHDFFKEANKPTEVATLMSDSALAVDLLNGKKKTKLPHLTRELQHIEYVMSNFPRVLFMWAPRDQTTLAHDQAMATLEESGVRIKRWKGGYGRAKG